MAHLHWFPARERSRRSMLENHGSGTWPTGTSRQSRKTASGRYAATRRSRSNSRGDWMLSQRQLSRFLLVILAIAAFGRIDSAQAQSTKTLHIHDIQGPGHVSPLAGHDVNDVPGIVTAVAESGFFMQDPTPDKDVATSEGIFVFTKDKPTVSAGDSVTVSGTVQEFRPGK